MDIINKKRAFKICKIPDDGQIFGLTIAKYDYNYYFTVLGRVPIEVALDLWDNEFDLRGSIRVNGNCLCPKPSGWQIKWYTPDNKLVLDMENYNEFVKYSESKSPLMREIAEAGLKNYVFSDNPQSIASGFIEQYHIDDTVSLRVFMDYMRKHNRQ